MFTKVDMSRYSDEALYGLTGAYAGEADYYMSEDGRLFSAPEDVFESGSKTVVHVLYGLSFEVQDLERARVVSEIQFPVRTFKGFKDLISGLRQVAFYL
jgi:hypothetical protein